MYKKCVKIIISGLVTGVGFRYNTREKALELGLVGYVKNLNHDKVEIVAEGEEKYINELINWCKKGPDSAEIEKTEITWQKQEGNYINFEIIN